MGGQFGELQPTISVDPVYYSVYIELKGGSSAPPNTGTSLTVTYLKLCLHLASSLHHSDAIVRVVDDSFQCVSSSFFLIWGDTHSLRMPALRPASQAGPMRNPREGTSVVLRDTTRLT